MTAVRAPKDFDVNGERVTTGPQTVYRLMNDKPNTNTVSLREAVRVGAYVRVMVDSDKGDTTMTAGVVLFREDWDRKLSGFGVIDKVIVAGAEPVFDGYHIQITPGTELSYGGGLKSLADVGTNTWIRYKGRRELDGVLVAAEAKFVPARTDKLKAILYPTAPPAKQEVVPREGARIDADGNLVSLRTNVRIGDADGWCGWHRVPADEAMQERVYRVGMSVVPDYQKQMATGDPSKIPFRFYVVDEPQIRSDVFCNDGLILIPKQALARLKNDDQLAALLADGVAYNLSGNQQHSLPPMRSL